VPGLVLIVEDGDELRDALVDAFTGRGDQAVGARHGLEALQRVTDGGVRPRVVILDLKMPVMDGAEFLNVASTHPLLADVPVVILTSADDDLPQPSALCAVLRKPTPLPKLFDIVDRLTAAQQR
jgi:CheY-like chemotaxis protein